MSLQLHPSSAASSAGIDPAILKEAAQWLTRFQANTLDEAAHAQWQQWKSSSPDHARAWEKAERLLGVLRTVPPELARALDRPAHPSRRQVIKAVLVGAGITPAAWLGWRVLEQQAGWALSTGVGQTRNLALGPGLMLTLNTDTRVKLDQSEGQARVHLVHGEVLLDSMQADLPGQGAVTLASAGGWLRLRQARVNLRQLGGSGGSSGSGGLSQASLIAGRAQLHMAGRIASTPLVAGQQAIFGQQVGQTHSLRVIQAGAAAASTSAWTQGVLYAENMRLADFLDELARYRHGYVVCDPAVAELRISGVFQLDDTRRVLVTLQRTLPVQVSFTTPWWVSVGAIART